jgi:hypothetical protein
MRVGDLFEWIAASAFVAAGYLEFRSIPLALAIFGVSLVYFAQCLAATKIPQPRLPRFHKAHLVKYVKRIHLIKFVKAVWKRKVDKNEPSPRPS